MTTVPQRNQATTPRSQRLAPPRAGQAPQPAPGAATEVAADAPADAPAGARPPRESGIPPHLRKATVFRRLADRLTLATHGKGVGEDGRQSVEMDGWCENATLLLAKQHAEDAVTSLRNSAELLEGLGADFNPLARGRRSSAATAAIGKGSLVRLRDKLRDPENGYGDLMTEDEMNNLTVTDVRGKKLVLSTPSGGKLFLPRGNVELVTA